MFQSITFDPGGVTGWSVFCIHDKAMVDPEYKILDNIQHWAAGEFWGKEDRIVDDMLELCATWPRARITTEDFVLLKFSQDRELLSPVRINAVLQYGLRGAGRHLYYQGSGIALTSVTDDRLKQWGFYTATAGKKDARSAVKHNLTVLRLMKEENIK